MTDYNTLSQRHTVEPEPFWTVAHGSGADGYDTMDAAAKRGWTAVAAWGEDGWDLGTWPYVILFTRSRGGRWEVAHYTEGDVTAYAFPDQAIRDTVLDSTAFWYWKSREEPWVAQYERVEQLPPRLRGPYGAQRAGAPQLVRTLVIPADRPADVWYVRRDLPTFTSIVDGPLQAVALAADAHLYCDEEGKLMRKQLNQVATSLWHTAMPQMAAQDVLVGDVVVLGQVGDDEADCPQWPIDAVIRCQVPPSA